MGRFTLLIEEHKKRAEQVRLGAANMFFRAMEEENLNKRRVAVHNTYQEIVFFLFQHDQLIESISATGVTPEESEIITLNNLITLMAAIIRSFPELGVYDCRSKEDKESREEKTRRYSI